MTAPASGLRPGRRPARGMTDQADQAAKQAATPGAQNEPATAAEAGKDFRQTWERDWAAMRRASEAIDWSGVDWSKLRPQDVGFQAAPFLLTEEQFAEYRKRAGGRVHVVSKAAKNGGPASG